MAIHLHLLPDGKILTWADDDSLMPTRLGDFSKAFVVAIPPNDRPASTVVEIDNTVTNLFCAGHAFLPDGRLLVVGGHEGTEYVGSAMHVPQVPERAGQISTMPSPDPHSYPHSAPS